MKFKLLLLLIVTIAAIIITATLHPIPQNPAYHLFADRRTLLGIPNCLNVLTNLPFLFVGIYGLARLKSMDFPGMIRVADAILYFGIFLTGLGSAYYHYAPDNNTLVWDRLPLAIIFMVFFSTIISRSVNKQLGGILLFPLLVAGIGSVLWWHYTETQGRGDLRFYGFIQYFPMLAIVLIILLFPSPANKRQWLSLRWVFAWYILAKIFEGFDHSIYNATHFISGHSLKHLASVVATCFMIKIGIDASHGIFSIPESTNCQK